VVTHDAGVRCRITQAVGTDFWNIELLHPFTPKDTKEVS
jgi:hypothetical protein